MNDDAATTSSFSALDLNSGPDPTGASRRVHDGLDYPRIEIEVKKPNQSILLRQRRQLWDRMSRKIQILARICGLLSTQNERSLIRLLSFHRSSKAARPTTMWHSHSTHSHDQPPSCTNTMTLDFLDDQEYTRSLGQR